MTWGLICLSFGLVIGLGVLAIYFTPKVISYLLEPKSGSMSSEKEKSSKTSSSGELESDNVKVKTDSSTASDTRKHSKEKESLLSRLNPFSRKEKCNECGTELEYREEYLSQYCPKCRTYK